MPPHLNTKIPSRPRVLHFVSDETSGSVGYWPVATPPVHLRARHAIANYCRSPKSANKLFKTILDGDCHEYHKILQKMPPVTRLVFISSIVWHLISQQWYVFGSYACATRLWVHSTENSRKQEAFRFLLSLLVVLLDPMADQIPFWFLTMWSLIFQGYPHYHNQEQNKVIVFSKLIPFISHKWVPACSSS